MLAAFFVSPAVVGAQSSSHLVTENVSLGSTTYYPNHPVPSGTVLGVEVCDDALTQAAFRFDFQPDSSAGTAATDRWLYSDDLRPGQCTGITTNWQVGWTGYDVALMFIPNYIGEATPGAEGTCTCRIVWNMSGAGPTTPVLITGRACIADPSFVGATATCESWSGPKNPFIG